MMTSTGAAVTAARGPAPHRSHAPGDCDAPTDVQLDTRHSAPRQSHVPRPLCRPHRQYSTAAVHLEHGGARNSSAFASIAALKPSIVASSRMTTSCRWRNCKYVSGEIASSSPSLPSAPVFPVHRLSIRKESYSLFQLQTIIGFFVYKFELPIRHRSVD